MTCYLFCAKTLSEPLLAYFQLEYKSKYQYILNSMSVAQQDFPRMLLSESLFCNETLNFTIQTSK